MNLRLLVLTLLLYTQAKADIKFVNFEKIDPERKYVNLQGRLLEYLPIYDHWVPDWVYKVPKDSVVNTLKSGLAGYSKLHGDPYETNLLLGELSHYLYNLNFQDYYDSAENFYLRAVAQNDKDCRGYWFLAYHYSLSNEIAKGAQWFDKAIERANPGTGKDFWQEYAFGMMLGGRFSHCRYALDKYKQQGGNAQLASMMDSTLKAKLLATDPDLTYQTRTLWQTNRPTPKKIVFISFILGMKFSVDSNWGMKVNGYAQKNSAVSFTPPMFTSKKGKQIGINIAVVVHVASENEQLKDFMATLIKGKGRQDNTFALPDYKGISYTFQDPDIYADRGGAHIHYIGIERDQPQYPGLALEDQTRAFKGEAGKIQFYTLNQTRTRLPGRIFYIWVLDTCEDIHEGSWATFQQLMQSVKLD